MRPSAKSTETSETAADEETLLTHLSANSTYRPGAYYKLLITRHKLKPIWQKPEWYVALGIVILALLQRVWPPSFPWDMFGAFTAILGLTVGMFALGYQTTKHMIQSGQLKDFAATPEGIAQPLIDLTFFNVRRAMLPLFSVLFLAGTASMSLLLFSFWYPPFLFWGASYLGTRFALGYGWTIIRRFLGWVVLVTFLFGLSWLGTKIPDYLRIPPVFYPLFLLLAIVLVLIVVVVYFAIQKNPKPLDFERDKQEKAQRERDELNKWEP